MPARRPLRGRGHRPGGRADLRRPAGARQLRVRGLHLFRPRRTGSSWSRCSTAAISTRPSGSTPRRPPTSPTSCGSRTGPPAKRSAIGTPPAGAAPILDAYALRPARAAAPSAAYAAALPPAQAAHRRRRRRTRICLGAGGRFAVKVGWQTASATGEADPVPFGSLESGLFSLQPAVELGAAGQGARTAGPERAPLDFRRRHHRRRLDPRDRSTGSTGEHKPIRPAGRPSITLTDGRALGGCP